MQPAESNPNRGRGLLWWTVRGVWGFLAAVHLWPFAAIGARLVTDPTLADAFWLASLVAVIGIFSLKAIDSPRLRFHKPGLECCVFIAAAALIHGDVVSRQTLPALTVETSAALVASAGVAAVSSRRVRRRLADWLRGLAKGHALRGRGLRPIGVLSLVAWRRPERVMLCAIPARAPPR